MQMLEERVTSGIDGILRQDESLSSFIDDVATGKLDTYSAAEKVFSSDAIFANLKTKLRSNGDSTAK